MHFVKNFLLSKSHPEKYPETLAVLATLDVLGKDHPDVQRAILAEIEQQRTTLKLIASENYSSLAVQLAMGNLLTDKYAEGAPFHRFYAGCSNVDAIEAEACEQLCQLFGCDHAYVQPHSGADANMVAFWAILAKRLQPQFLEKCGVRSIAQLTDVQFEELRQLFCSQTVLGMSLPSGGHLTHGARVNMSAKFMRAVTYDVDPKTHLLDYDAILEIARREKPAILIAGFSAYSRNINFAKMRAIADEVGATLLVDFAHFSGLVAGGVLTGEENPIPYADVITSTTHKSLRGPRGGLILCTNAYKEYIDKGCPFVLGGPLPHVMAAKLVAFREAAQPEFRTYAQRVVENARALAQSLQDLGATILTGGTDNHIVLIDVQASFGLTGMQAEKALTSVGILANRNSIPGDTNGPWFCSGIRLGSLALTTRGLGTSEMRKVGRWIFDILATARPAKNEATKKLDRGNVILDEKRATKVKEDRGKLLADYPLYPEIPEFKENYAGRITE